MIVSLVYFLVAHQIPLAAFDGDVRVHRVRLFLSPLGCAHAADPSPPPSRALPLAPCRLPPPPLPYTNRDLDKEAFHECFLNCLATPAQQAPAAAGGKR